MLFEDTRNAETVRDVARTQVAAGNAAKLRDHIDTAAENVYGSLPSGDYGRGDVRRVLLAMLDALDSTGKLVALGYPAALLAEGIAPAHSAEGDLCAQCGALAWRVDCVPFCMEHSQATLARSEARAMFDSDPDGHAL